MFRFGRKQSTGRGIRASLLAGATVIALGIGGVSASGASAAPSCTGANIIGEGASLQKESQLSIWIPGFQGAGGVCAGKGTEPKVTYEPTGSGAGLRAWDFNGPDEKAFDTTRAFVASDDAPTPAQIGNAKTAAGGGSQVLVIPVTQTAIGIVVNPPAECEVEEITNQQLESALRGNILKWGKLETAFGPGCAGKNITRVVRFDGSGTTYQFKNYLSLINGGTLPCTEAPGKTWKDLEPIGAGGKPNITWPENGVGGCAAGTVSPVTTAGKNNGTELVKKVNATDGSIGYAALADIEVNKTGDTHAVKVQNNGTKKISKATYAEPGTEFGNANCSAAEYTVPTAGQVGGSGENVDWSQVFGANLSIGGSDYPLCTLTYDIAWKGYGAAGFSEATTTTVIDYLREYITAAAGQEDIDNGEKFYSPLPSPLAAKHNVLGAAQLAATKIGF